LINGFDALWEQARPAFGQERTPEAVAAVPRLMAAAYAFLLLAGTGDTQVGQGLPLPKWR